MSIFPVLDYLEEAAPDQVVKATLRILGTYHEIQAERISGIIHGFDDTYMAYLEETWKRLSFTHTSRMDALGSLTRIIAEDMAACTKANSEESSVDEDGQPRPANKK